MVKDNPVVRLAKRRKKGEKKKGVNMKATNVDRDTLRKAIRAEMYNLRKEGEGEELEVQEDEEEDKLDRIEDELGEILAYIREDSDEDAAVGEDYDEDGFDEDETDKAIKAIAKEAAKEVLSQLRKEEEKHKVKVPHSSVDTGRDEREVEEDEGYEDSGDESPERADRNVLEAEKANYKNEASKAKELPEKALLSQKVVPNETIPSQRSASRAASKSVTPRGVQGRMPPAADSSINGAFDGTGINKSVSGNSTSGVIEQILKGKKAHEVKLENGETLW